MNCIGSLAQPFYAENNQLFRSVNFNCMSVSVIRINRMWEGTPTYGNTVCFVVLWMGAAYFDLIFVLFFFSLGCFVLAVISLVRNEYLIAIWVFWWI